MDLNSNLTAKQILEERLVVLEIAFDRLEQKFHQREKWCEILNLWISQQFDFNIETYWLDLIGEAGVGDGADPESADVTNIGAGAGAHGQMFEMQNMGFYTEMPISMEYDDSREAQAQDPLEYLQQDESEETRNEVEFGGNKKYIVPCYTFVDEDEREVEEGGEILESNNGGDVEGVENSLEMETEMEADSTNNIDNFEIRQENGPEERNECARSAARGATGDVTLEHLLSTPPKQGPSTTDIDAIINRLDASSRLNREQLNEANLNSAQGPFTFVPFSQSQSSGMTNNKSQSQNKNQQQIIQLGNQNSADPQQSSMMGGGGGEANFMQFPVTFVPLGIALTSSPAVSAAPKSIQPPRTSPQVHVELHQQQKEQSQPKQSGPGGAGQIRVGSTSPPNSSSILKDHIFPCSRCQKKFCSLDAVEAHLKTHRAKQREKIGHCEHCGKVYRTWKFFQKHCVSCVMDTQSKTSNTSEPNNDHWGIISKDLSESIANNNSNTSDSIHSTNTATSDSSSTKKSKPKQSTSASITANIARGPGTVPNKKPAKPRPSRSKAAKRERALLISNMCANNSKSNTKTASPVPVSMSAGTGSSVVGTEAATMSSQLGRGSVTGGAKNKKPSSKDINSMQDIAALPTLYEPNADDLVHPSFFRNSIAAGVEVQSKPTKSPPEFTSSSSSAKANKGNLPTPTPTKVPAGKLSGSGGSLDPYELIASPTARPNSNSNSNSSLPSTYNYRSMSQIQKRPEKNDEEAVLVFNCKVCRLPFTTLQQCRQHIITTHLAQVLQTTPVLLESTATVGAKTPKAQSGAASPSTSRTSSATTTTTTTTSTSITPSVLSPSAMPAPSAPVPVSVPVPATVPPKTVTPTATTTIPNLDFHLNSHQQNLSPLHSQFNLNNTASAFPLSFPSSMLSPTMTTSIGGFPNLTNFANLANLASLTNLANLVNFSHLAAENHQNLIHLGNSSNPLNLNFNYANMAANLANPLNLNFANSALNLNHMSGPSPIPIYSPSNVHLGLNDVEEVSSGIEQNQITFHSVPNPGSYTSQGSAKTSSAKKGGSAGGSRTTGRASNANSRLKSLLTQAQEVRRGFGSDEIITIESLATPAPTPTLIPTPTPTPVPAVTATATTRTAATAMATTTTSGNNAMTRPSSSSCSSSSLIIDENETENSVPSPENMYPYICLHCKRLGVTQGFESGQEIHEHILRHHVTTIRFHCPFSFCQQVFLEQDAFEEHIVSDHRMPL